DHSLYNGSSFLIDGRKNNKHQKNGRHDLYRFLRFLRKAGRQGIYNHADGCGNNSDGYYFKDGTQYIKMKLGSNTHIMPDGYIDHYGNGEYFYNTGDCRQRNT